MPVALDVIAGWVRFQAQGCAELGSPFYAALLDDVADDVETGGPAAAIFADFATETGWSALALRLMGSVHRLVLAGEAPALAARYPSTGGDGDAERAWPDFRALLSERADQVRTLLRRGCQTNEVGRCAALLGGFLEVARRTGLPLRILEIGASAGLNLRWDRYRYEAGGAGWGDPNSPVRFTTNFEVPPSLDVEATVAERRGCDLNPIEATTDEGSLTLRSFIWADQLDRFRLLESAIVLASRVPTVVEKLDAIAFLRRELSTARTDVATVVYHSVFLQYLDDATREEISSVIRSAGVSRLSMEPRGDSWVFDVRLNGELLGTSGAHGSGVRWLVS